MDWLPGAIVLPANKPGGTQNTSYPPRLVLHTTEGTGTVQDLAAFYRNTSGYWPTMTVDLVRKQIAQHLPFSRGAYALTHTTATETNNANCQQIEIIGFASQAASWPSDQIDWFGHVLAPMFNALGIVRKAPVFVNGGAGFNAPQRFSEPTWHAFSGVCGHQHVPENDHWDPGAFNVARFLAATVGPPPIPEDDVTPQDKTDIAKLVVNALVVDNGGGQYSGILTEMVKAELAGALKAAGLPKV